MMFFLHWHYLFNALVVVSDHGMTDSGNHGGSSYEETDSLALFIGLGTKVPDYIAIAHNAVFQVDIVPTLALLFGVPIPKNNVGVFLAESLDLLTDEQKLRALELNSWQLLRLLQAHLPSLLCGDLNCIVSDVEALESDGSVGSIKKKLCHLLSRALVAHKLWERRHSSGLISNNTDDLALAVGSYYDFLRNASEWLSLKATDKPISLLLPGIIIMLISSVLLFNLLFCLTKEVQFSQKHCCPHMKKCSNIWHLDEAFVVLGILLHALSLGASSMVEEEQYTWNFLTSTLYLIFLLATLQSLLKERASGSIKMLGVENCTFCQSLGSNTSDGAMFTNYGLEKLNGMREYCYQISSIIVVLICGRILRCWHQGGVNWTHLPDISKWLEQAGSFSIKLLQIIALILVMILSSIALCLIKSGRNLVLLILSSHIVSGLLVFLHIMERQCNDLISVDHNSTLLVQICYITLGMTTLVAVIASPWTLPVDYCKTRSVTNAILDSDSLDTQIDSLLLGIRDSTYLMGLTSTSSWCLLQLLLQQPINAVPILLIFLQILASIFCFATSESHHGQWVEIAAIYFVGMTGHYGLGNSNSLATIDVAGAFIGISSYSTVLSGILMFIITYGSPMLSFLSLVVYIPMKKMRYTSDPKKSKLACVLKTMIALPCVLPLVLNSVVLTVFTIILLLMRNHLFVWSVFSPKFLYNCAATVNVYIGVCIIAAMGVYVCTVFFFRAGMLCRKDRLISSNQMQ